MRKGFTLVELAIVLVVLGLIIGLGMPLFGLLVKQNKITETKTIVKEDKVALVGFIQIHGRLPWADTNGDGKEDTNSTTGNLPYVTLGVRGQDAWLQPIRYDVNQKLASTSDLSGFCQALTLISTNGSPDYPQTSAGEMAAVLFSLGENRHPDGQDADVDSPSNDRVYEDEARALSENNDDIVGELSLSYLAGLLCTGGSSSGSGGTSSCSTYTAIIRNLVGTKYVTVGSTTCQSLSSSSTRTYRNLSPGTSIRIFRSLFRCFTNRNPILSGTASGLDQNGDCSDNITCTSLTSCNAQ